MSRRTMMRRRRRQRTLERGIVIPTEAELRRDALDLVARQVYGVGGGALVARYWTRRRRPSRTCARIAQARQGLTQGGIMRHVLDEYVRCTIEMWRAAEFMWTGLGEYQAGPEL